MRHIGFMGASKGLVWSVGVLTLPWPAQASGLVPIVEPEVLLDGDHDIDRTLEVAQAIWAQTFKYMADNKVCTSWRMLLSMLSTRDVRHCWTVECWVG